MTKPVIVDPPSGWRYGFPLAWDKDKHPDFRQWLIESGYPEADVDFAVEYSRFWYEKES